MRFKKINCNNCNCNAHSSAIHLKGCISTKYDFLTPSTSYVYYSKKAEKLSISSLKGF